jgi:hypothetical protein
MKTTVLAAFCKTAVVLLGMASLASSADIDHSSVGTVHLQSVGMLAFTPQGVLLIGDNSAASIIAVELNDGGAANAGSPIDIKRVDEKIAALLGTMPDQILIEDLAVNPVSKLVYLSISRGRGANALPVLVRVESSGQLSVVSLDNVKHSEVKLPDPVAADDVDQQGQSQRMQTITSMAYVDGTVLVAGLSNEDFSSTLHSIPFPFQNAGKGVGVKIYHSSHQRFETQAPIRTFVPYAIDGQSYILAAYTCTPLVKIPVADLQPGGRVEGTTIANLGEGNRPIDMISYTKDGNRYFLMANSSLGVTKLSADNLGHLRAITTPTEGPAGIHIERIRSLQGVEHLTKLDDSTALLLVVDGNGKDLRTMALP